MSRVVRTLFVSIFSIAIAIPPVSAQQAQDQALYQQFLAQQGYPFQTTQWLAGIDTGVGSQMGGTSTTTGPPPNPWNTIAGLGATAYRTRLTLSLTDTVSPLHAPNVTLTVSDLLP